MTARRMLLGLAALGLLSCGGITSPTGTLTDLYLPAEVSVSRASIAVEFVPAPIILRLRNSSATAASVRYGVCAFAVQGFTSQTRSGTPEWVHLLPQLGGCGPDILYSSNALPNADTSVEIGTIPTVLLNRAPYLKLVYRVAGQSSLNGIAIEPVAID